MFVLASGYQLLIMYLFACLSYYRSLSDVLKRETGVHGVDGPCLPPPIMAPILSEKPELGDQYWSSPMMYYQSSYSRSAL
jgi:hypothetical protein